MKWKGRRLTKSLKPTPRPVQLSTYINERQIQNNLIWRGFLCFLVSIQKVFILDTQDKVDVPIKIHSETRRTTVAWLSSWNWKNLTTLNVLARTFFFISPSTTSKGKVNAFIISELMCVLFPLKGVVSRKGVWQKWNCWTCLHQRWQKWKESECLVKKETIW